MSDRPKSFGMMDSLRNIDKSRAISIVGGALLMAIAAIKMHMISEIHDVSTIPENEDLNAPQLSTSVSPSTLQKGEGIDPRAPLNLEKYAVRVNEATCKRAAYSVQVEQKCPEDMPEVIQSCTSSLKERPAFNANPEAVNVLQNTFAIVYRSCVDTK